MIYNVNIAFQEEYKKLDALCKDMFGGADGLSEYIRQIEALTGSERILCEDTETVYARLKKLRWLRNRLVHEVGTWDEPMCDEADIQWLKNFYGRILAINDPLAVIYKAKREREAGRRLRAAGGNSVSTGRVANNDGGKRTSLWSRFVGKLKNIFAKK